MKLFRLPALPALVLIFAGAGLYAQALADETGRRPPVSAGSTAGEAENYAEIPLRKITIYSSGVALFEHSGTLPGPAVLKFPFRAGAVNDALKSLTLKDPASASPLVTYPSEQILWETLRSLSIDLSGSPGMAEILSGLRGEELEVSAPDSVTGRITALEYRAGDGESAAEPWLSLFTSRGIRLINLREINSFRFTNPRINADLNKALDLIMASGNSGYRDLTLSLPGNGSRPVSVAYVIPAPVWKISYRLDLDSRRTGGADVTRNGAEALLQGWALVDNDGGADWKDVELSLVAGRPVSFIQNLYPPYYVDRPTLPLAIAGAAEAETWDSAFGLAPEARAPAPALRNSFAAKEAADEIAEAAAPLRASARGTVDTARAAALGDQFEFAIKKPVTLNRRQSAMLPLLEESITAAKLLILSGRRAPGNTVHPNLGAELTNTTGMKLPAGPITVYDGGAYAGDALIEFFNPGEKRLVSWGEDLSVTAAAAESGSRFVAAVSVGGGLMTISRKQVYIKTYTLKNASGEAKRVLVEHPVTAGTELAEPASPAEKTASAYRV
ncbi:MAG: DUF4139 domain-containing protein, partial [Treponema sp.]|nr:DUF4139 domain-containing protein [Treponema sp.]